MKVALISAANSIHTIRWANGLARANNEVHILTQHSETEPVDSDVTIHKFSTKGMLGYFIMAAKVSELLMKIRPDIVNAHYASGYGTTARLVGYHPYLLSVWGSDVYDFPHKSSVHKWLIRKNLLAADKIASTSCCMASETQNIIPECSDIAITPFGVDLDAYASIQPLGIEKKSKLVVGTVKSMAPKYGIDTLLFAYAELLQRVRDRSSEAMLPKPPALELRLVGDGNQTSELQALAVRLGIAGSVTFVGRVPHSQVPQELAKLDIYVALSNSESFGVAIIEAGAAARPVVVSDAGGLPEVTLDGKTGIVVPKKNPSAAADALEKLIFDAELRSAMGKAGRCHVSKNYSWDYCVDTMLKVYEQTIQSYKDKSL